ncbi:MAG: DUF4385 domain-containing protein [Alphaproteobacteria bacterium TMED194]|nr:MAG: DUF4385 domain-containing protein [Alphaproteobacteria bacterium TMED194]|tara:strand:- start:32 stop:529 length:498 start_codon:yes stop_codon:yes gene_type:complete
MKEFDYNLDYKHTMFRPNDTRYRIGRGEQGVLLVRPYTENICQHWRFKTVAIAKKSAKTIYEMYVDYKKIHDFVGMDMCRKFLEMGFTRARRYANHKDGRKYVQTHDEKFRQLPQAKDWATNEKAKAARVFKKYRDLVTHDETYIEMRKSWRQFEKNYKHENSTI